MKCINPHWTAQILWSIEAEMPLKWPAEDPMVSSHVIHAAVIPRHGICGCELLTISSRESARDTNTKPRNLPGFSLISFILQFYIQGNTVPSWFEITTPNLQNANHGDEMVYGWLPLTPARGDVIHDYHIGERSRALFRTLEKPTR